MAIVSSAATPRPGAMKDAAMDSAVGAAMDSARPCAMENSMAATHDGRARATRGRRSSDSRWRSSSESWAPNSMVAATCERRHGETQSSDSETHAGADDSK